MSPGSTALLGCEGGLGVLRGHLYDILLPARPFASATSTGKRRGPSQSSTDPPRVPDSLPQRHDMPSERPSMLPSPAAPVPRRHRQKRCPTRMGGLWSVTAGSCLVLLFAVLLMGLPLPLQSLPKKLDLGTMGAAMLGFVRPSGASSAPTAPPKGLTRTGKPVSPLGDGRVAVVWGPVGFGYPPTSPRAVSPTSV